MSSPLPPALRMSIKDGARDSKGRVRCARCGKPFADKDIQIDHIHPEAEGGSHDPLNLQPLCAPKQGGGCHRLKSREEAKARARMARKAERNLLRLPLSMLGIATGSWGLAYAATDFTGQQATFVANSQTAATWTVLAGLGLGAAYALANIRVVPDSQEEAPKPADADVEALEFISERATEAAREVMGDKGTILVTVASLDVFDLSYKGTGFAAHNDARREELRAAIQMKVGDRWRTEWKGKQDKVRFTRRPTLPPTINHPGFDKKRPWWELPVAEGCTINLKVTSHALVIGRTNMGKTALMRGLIAAGTDSASRGEVELVLMDPKRVELVGFRDWPGVRKVLTNDEDLWDAPINLRDEMDERHRLFEEEKVPLSSHPPIMVVCDEYEQYVIRMTDRWINTPGLKKPGQKIPPPVQAMTSLLSMARKCNIHIIIGTQRPDAAWFGGTARDNLAARLGVGPLSASARKMLWGDGHADVGGDIPDTAKGRTTVQLGDGEFTEIQAYWVPDPGDSDGNNTEQDWAVLASLRS
jgi:DNA translocase FtsK/SpoIIIE-like protein/HNH endonuclease